MIEGVESQPGCKQHDTAERQRGAVLAERKPGAAKPVGASRCEAPNRRPRSIVRDRNCTGRQARSAIGRHYSTGARARRRFRPLSIDYGSMTSIIGRSGATVASLCVDILAVLSLM